LMIAFEVESQSRNESTPVLVARRGLSWARLAGFVLRTVKNDANLSLSQGFGSLQAV